MPSQTVSKWVSWLCIPRVNELMALGSQRNSSPASESKLVQRQVRLDTQQIAPFRT